MPTTNPAPIWKRKRPESLGEPVPLTPKQKAAAKAMAKAAGRKYPNLVDNIAASRLENPTMKTTTKRKPTPAQLAARERFAEMARSGAFKKANPAMKKIVYESSPSRGKLKQYVVRDMEDRNDMGSDVAQFMSKSDAMKYARAYANKYKVQVSVRSV